MSVGSHELSLLFQKVLSREKEALVRTLPQAQITTIVEVDEKINQMTVEVEVHQGIKTVHDSFRQGAGSLFEGQYFART